MAVQPPISGKTRVLAVIGDPVEHSLSPVFQNEALKAIGMDAVYVPLRITAAELKPFLQGLAHSSILGFNVTVPHKEDVFAACAKLTPEAEAAGAVNTVEVKGGKLIGHNTDGKGFMASLAEETAFDPRRKKVCVLGAGGASRGIVYSLAKAGAAEIVVCNRTPARANKLVADLRPKVGKARLTAATLRKGELGRALSGASLIVQTTPVGLDGRGLIVLPWGVIPRDVIIADIVYGGDLTPFLAEAKRRRHPVLGGLGMLIHQGAFAFEIWTGKKPDAALMRKAAEKAIRQKSAKH